MGRYEDLRVWQVAHALSGDIRQLVRGFPRSDRFELTSQLRRATVSVAANLVEGSGLAGPRAFLRHVRISIASLREVDYLVLNAHEEGYIGPDKVEDLKNQIRHTRVLLYRLARSLQKAAGQKD